MHISTDNRIAHRPPRDLSGLKVDMDVLLGDISRAFNPLHRDCLLSYHVKAISPEQVCMSVAMPADMLKSFTTLLESLGGFYRVVNYRTRSTMAEIKSHDLAEIAAGKDRIESFTNEVCMIFDELLKSGLDRRTALKQTNSALKAQNNPYATYYIVEKTLRATGRLRKEVKKV